MEFTGERMIPEHNKKNVIYGEHIARYIFASQFTKGKSVLDIASGAGYGSAILAKNGANKVQGGDISEETVEYATKEFGNDIINFTVQNAESMSFEDNTFDTLVSFETIEHLEDYKKFLDEVKRVLKKDGVALISTPNKAIYPEGNAFHTKEFFIDEFERELKKYFKNVQLEYQDNFLTNAIYSKTDDIEKAESKAEVENEHEPLYVVAICSDAKIPDYERVNFTFSSNELGSGMMQEKLENVIAWAKSLDKEIEEKNARIVQLQEEVYERNNHLAKLDSLIANERSQKSNEPEKEEIKKENKCIEEKYKCLLLQTVDSLNKKDAELNRIIHSRSFKLGKLLTSPFRLIFPHSSKRRLILKLFLKGLKHPIKFLKKITPTNIGKLLKILKTNNAQFIENKFDNCIHGSNFSVHHISDLSLDIIDNVDIKKLITFKEYKNPKVSIIIPVYNNWEYTYKCLLSIQKHTHNIDYEIIIGDDYSHDETKNLEKYVEGVKVVRNKENLMFLKNCNTAAKVASGTYLYFLNNDTNVQENWLTPLVTMMEKDETIGMTGSKLVYPDGTLQEAGGIIWKDASAWNYGKNNNPSLPEFNYVKEVDYISGTGIMIRKDLWQKIGGFDETFTPAYYEDSDLAFEVRKKGYRVVYQPHSLVVHFEGKSHGTDTGSGLKKYQVENQQKFYEKWKKELKGHYKNGENVFLSRDRSRDKKTILVIDHYVPTYDKDAGSRTIFQYMKLLVKMGYNVKFLGDNFHKPEPYTTKLEQAGIEVLYGHEYQENWESWIKENSNHINFVYFHRSHITVKYIDFVKEHTQSKIIYNAVDFSFIRERRQYEITGDEKYLEQAKVSEKIEHKLFKKSDVIITISEFEQKILKELMPHKEVQMIPTYIYDVLPNCAQKFDDRSDITFVGGFTHEPNKDGILWFLESIFPLILKEYPEVKLNIIGSKAPDEILNLVSENINITGFITDEELNKYYEKTRVIIAPLRFGAGVKGKVIEAIAHAIPFVTTTVGAEGIIDSQDIMNVADTEEEFAEKVISLLNDKKLWEECKKSLKEYGHTYLSAKNAKKTVEDIFN